MVSPDLAAEGFANQRTLQLQEFCNTRDTADLVLAPLHTKGRQRDLLSTVRGP